MAAVAGAPRAAPVAASPWIDPLPRPALSADPSVPSPEVVLGAPLGSHLLSPEEIHRYAVALAAASPRAALFDHGQSVEGRPLFHLVISDPQRLAGLADGGVDGPARTLAAEDPAPAVIWLAGSIHGDEHSSSEALLALAWHLAADSGEAGAERLRRLVVVVDPLQNPDGRARFLAHQAVSRFGLPNADPQAWEHQQDWPGGRGNHYFFDLNRDWFLLTQPETRARLAALRNWRPQVFVDLHEMGGDSSYFFAPPALPIHPQVPAAVRAWWSTFGDALAEAFDRRGAPFYRRERFDLFYPGYGDSWPTFQGAVGMTYEQASVQGLLRRRQDGRPVPLGEAIGNHLTAALATVDAAAARFTQLRRDLAATGSADAEDGLTVFLPRGRHEERLQRLIRRLTLQGVAVERLTADTRLRHLTGYRGEGEPPQRLAAGTYVVRAAAGTLAAALFEPEAGLQAEFVAEERRALLAGQPGRIYDVTAWSLPLVYDLPAWWTKGIRSGLDIEPLPEGGEADAGADAPRPRAAYLLPPDGLSWARAVGALLDAGVTVRVSSRAMTREGRELPAGTAVVPVGGAGADLHETVRRIGRETGISWLGADSSASLEGPDLGSDRVFSLRKAPVALLAGEPVLETSFGAVADLLAGAGGRPFTALPVSRLSRADLSRYGVLILPDGEAEAWRAAVSGPGLEALKAWVQAGGILVALRGAAAFCGDPKVALCRTRPVVPEGEGGKEAPQPPEQALWRVPGAILRVELDAESRLAFGRSAEVAVPVRGDLALEAPVRRDVRVVGRYAAAERLRLAGLIWPEASQRLAGRPWLVREQHGRGAVVLFADDPVFRGAWDGLRAMLMNALLLESGP